MDLYIRFKDPDCKVQIINMQCVKADDYSKVTEITDFKDFMIDPRFRYTFIGNSIVSCNGDQILFVKFD